MAILGVGTSPVNGMEAINSVAREMVHPIVTFVARFDMLTANCPIKWMEQQSWVIPQIWTGFSVGAASDRTEAGVWSR